MIAIIVFAIAANMIYCNVGVCGVTTPQGAMLCDTELLCAGRADHFVATIAALL